MLSGGSIVQLPSWYLSMADNFKTAARESMPREQPVDPYE